MIPVKMGLAAPRSVDVPTTMAADKLQKSLDCLLMERFAVQDKTLLEKLLTSLHDSGECFFRILFHTCSSQTYYYGFASGFRRRSPEDHTGRYAQRMVLQCFGRVSGTANADFQKLFRARPVRFRPEVFGRAGQIRRRVNRAHRDAHCPVHDRLHRCRIESQGAGDFQRLPVVVTDVEQQRTGSRVCFTRR